MYDTVIAILSIAIPLAVIILGIYFLVRKETDPIKKKQGLIKGVGLIVTGIVGSIVLGFIKLYEQNNRTL